MKSRCKFLLPLLSVPLCCLWAVLCRSSYLLFVTSLAEPSVSRCVQMEGYRFLRKKSEKGGKKLLTVYSLKFKNCVSSICVTVRDSGVSGWNIWISASILSARFLQVSLARWFGLFVIVYIIGFTPEFFGAANVLGTFWNITLVNLSKGNHDWKNTRMFKM